MALASDLRQLERAIDSMRAACEHAVDEQDVQTFLDETLHCDGEPHVRTPRWFKLRHHDKQQQFLRSEARFNISPSGRRSGKTECAKRRLVRKAMMGMHTQETLFVAAAPTHQQAKRIYWRDLKRMVPPQFVVAISESELTIDLVNGAQIIVTGMDKPERVEGPPIGHALFDEFADMKPQSWTEHARPALADTRGSADFVGVPAGRNHFYDMYLDALADDHGEWGVWHWYSEEMLPAEEIDAMRRTMDERTFRQETQGSFEDFAGRAYYGWFTNENASMRLEYMPDKPLVLCFDFNVSPGVAVIVQEFPRETDSNGVVTMPAFTGVIGEVYIEDNSNTPLVCERLAASWGQHKGDVFCYGDPAGGARHTQGVEGTDWQIIRRKLAAAFGDRVFVRVAKRAPSQRDRINAMNSRCRTEDGTIRLRVDPAKARMMVRDFEGVACDDSGNIDKTNKWLTHLTDALGYYVEAVHPVREDYVVVRQM